MPEKLILNDDTVLTGHAFESDGFLYVYVYENTLTNVFRILNKSGRTARITEVQGTDETVYIGYTHLKAVREEDQTLVTAVLRKEVT